MENKILKLELGKEDLEKIAGGSGNSLSLVCPYCNKNVPIDLNLLLNGGNITCPYCKCLLSITTRNDVKHDALDNLNKWRKNNGN